MSSIADTSSTPIFDATAACRRTFKGAKAVARLMRQEWAENRMADFNLWATGAGASASGKASLDYRLQDNREARTIIVNLLLMLDILLQQCIEEAHEDEEEDKVKDTALSQEKSTRMVDVEDSLNQLTRLTLAIRKAGTKSRLLKADASFDPDSPQICALRRHLELLLLVSPNTSKTSASSSQQLNPARLSPVQRRLIEANLLRRNRFLYAQRHVQKMSSIRKQAKRIPPDTPSLVLQAANPGSRKTVSTYREEAVPAKAFLPTQSTTTATMVDEPIVIPPKEISKSPTTVVSQFFSVRVAVSPCLPISGKGTGGSKKHLIGDVLPYTCILEECPKLDTFYVTKKEWLAHMNKEHNSALQWVCQTCLQKSIHIAFDEADEFISHIKQQHGEGIKPHHIPILLSAWRRKTPLEITACPLCGFEGDGQSTVLDHTAEHVHSFALRSLPWNDDVEENDGHISYFEQYPYFDTSSSESDQSSGSREVSSLGSNSNSYGAISESSNRAYRGGHEILTEETLQQIPDEILGEADTKIWLATLGSEERSQNTVENPEGNSLADGRLSEITRESGESLATPEESPRDITQSAPGKEGAGDETVQRLDFAAESHAPWSRHGYLHPWSEDRSNANSFGRSLLPRYGSSTSSVVSGGVLIPVFTTGAGPSPRAGHACSLIGNTYVVFGGSSQSMEGGVLGDVSDGALYLLDTLTETWSQAPRGYPWPQGRRGHTMNSIGTKIYIFGGEAEGVFLKDLNIYDLDQPSYGWKIEQRKNNTNEQGANWPEARANHTAVTYGGKLYIFGGSNGADYLNDVWCYDPITSLWHELDCVGHRPLGRGGHAAAIVDDTMYVFGGRTEMKCDLDDLIALDIPRKQWYTFHDTGARPSARSDHSMSVLGRQIVVMAGRTQDIAEDLSPLSMIYILDTMTLGEPQSLNAEDRQRKAALARKAKRFQPSRQRAPLRSMVRSDSPFDAGNEHESSEPPRQRGSDPSPLETLLRRAPPLRPRMHDSERSGQQGPPRTRRSVRSWLKERLFK
ncbi:hypothetical protein BJX61DRAFT_547065 [Aspergillus egyptiacus]|nr:hypothetical protein BJX61DRAFT_547065 [Aspergillus egyptiacus]